MSLQSTKDNLVQLLSDQDNKVIALSGKWGTGKSHLWREVKDASKDSKIKGSLYVSLFGLSSLDEVKLKIVQSAVPAADAHPELWKGARKIVESGLRVLEGFHKGLSALGDLALLVAPAILRNKLIVLDDIERKHEKLGIDEVLGFIDEFTQQHGARFVLILNSDQLANRGAWDTLREKVVDQEIRLDTSPAEAFGIAIALAPSRYADRIKAAADACVLTNIRVIRKVIKAVNRILEDRKSLSDSVLSRVIPSTVLLAAINYKGIEEGPDFDFVLAQGTLRDGSVVAGKGKKEDDEDKRRARWKLLLNELGIHYCDDYEMLVVEFLQSGLFDVGAVAAIINRYVAENDAMNARDESHRFFERMAWDFRLTEPELLETAKALVPKAPLLDPYTVTELFDVVSGLSGGKIVADAIVSAWIEAFKAKKIDDFNDDNPFNNRIHPLIQAEFDAIKARAQANTTVFDACVHIAKHSGWGVRQELAMKSASVADFVATIKSADVQGLRMFMRRMLEMCIQKQTYEPHFGTAMDRFVEACKIIVQDPRSDRLGKLIRSLFANSKLVDLMDPPAPPNMAASTPSGTPPAP